VPHPDPLQIVLSIYDKLFKASNLLNLGLSVQQLLNHEAAQDAARKDAEFIKDNQAIILSLCEQSVQGINRVQEHLELVIERQLRSIRLQFNKVIPQEGKSPSGSREVKRESRSTIPQKYIISSFDLAFEGYLWHCVVYPLSHLDCAVMKK